MSLRSGALVFRHLSPPSAPRMASEPLLEFEELLAPIPGDEPAGTSLPFEVRQKLDEARKEDNPEDYDADDPRRPEQPKKADWPGIIRLSQQTLSRTTKDLLLGARLTEALVKEHRFAGLRDGLHLMRLMLEQCWDRLSPPVESPDDLEIRAAAFNWLDDPDRGARFPNTLRMTPLVFGEDGAYGWLTWRQSQDGKGPVKREDFEKAMQATTWEACKEAADAIDASLEELNQLTAVLSAKLGNVAPGFTSLRPTLIEVQTLVKQILQRKPPPAGAVTADGEEGAEGEGEGEAGGRGGARGRVATREQVYRQLADAAALLQQIEPHSPIPYLIQKACELGALPFPLLMKALIRDEAVLSEMNRELGIKEEEG